MMREKEIMRGKRKGGLRIDKEKRRRLTRRK